MFARDLDVGQNGELEYSLEEVDGENNEKATRLLSVHPKLGVVQTAGLLDREEGALLRFSVIARDKGEPPRQSSAFIEITLIDVNDNAPVFEQVNLSFLIESHTT